MNLQYRRLLAHLTHYPSQEIKLMMMGLSTCEQSNTELLRSQAHIWNHIFSFINSMSLKSAIQLEIPDIINNHGNPMTLSELTEALSIKKEKSHNIYRLMRILVHSGFFVKLKIPKGQEDDEEEEEDGYSLTPASKLLLKDGLLSVRPFLLAMLDPVLVDPWHHISEWVRTDDTTPFETTHGRTLWDYMGHEPKLNKLNNLFNEAMASDALLTSVVIKEYPGAFKGLNSLVDVGGGNGTLAMMIADAFPLMKCSNFDLPHVIAGLEGSKNLTHVEGDMFVAVPPADAILLKWILHDWSDVNCVKILKRCKEAIPSREKRGKVMIIDMIVGNTRGDDKSIETQLFFDMLMMVVASGRERNEKEWAKIFCDAGFSDYKISTIMGLRSLIEVYP